jgi:RecA/RadA recombinase
MSKKFNLDNFKKTIKTADIAYKKAKYVELDPAIQEVIKLPGLPMGHITFSYGLSDTAKTSLLFEAAAKAQEQGILPVIILTGPEKKVDWARARKMGLNYTGDLPKDEQQNDEFIIVEESLDYIEDVFEFINNKIINEVEQGKLPFDVQIFWDSAGNTLCRDAVKVDKKTGMIETKDMHMKAAKVLGENLLILSDRVTNSRKETRPYFIGCHFITSMYKSPPAFPGAPSSWSIKGGTKVKFVSSLMIKHELVKKLKATKDGKELKFGMNVKLSVTKNHINGQEYSGEFIVTEDSVLPNEKDSVEEYKKRKSSEWGEFEVTTQNGEVFEGNTEKRISVTQDAPELMGD